MGIEIKLKTPKSEVQATINAKGDLLKKAVTRQMSVIGEKVVNYARTNGSGLKDYIDRTGNLRSSIGYIVTQDGNQQSQGGFNQVLSGAEGVQKGKQHAQEVASRGGSDVSLVVVAGMNYAEYVERRGYDVLSGAKLECERLVSEMVNDLKNTL